MYHVIAYLNVTRYC